MSSSSRQVVMPARYYHKGTTRASSVEIGASSVEGVLRMTEENFVFTPSDPTTECAVEVNECFSQIERSPQYTKSPKYNNLLKLIHNKGQVIWFGFHTAYERDVCLYFAGVVHAIQKKKKKIHHVLQLTAEEKERPNNSCELLKQHKQFVTDGMLTEAEDKATRKTLKFRIRLPPEIVHQVSGLRLDESQVEGIMDDTKDAITTISTRKSTAERTKEEDFDADEWELLEAEDEQEEKVYDQVGRLGTLIKKFKTSFSPVSPTLL